MLGSQPLAFRSWSSCYTGSKGSEEPHKVFNYCCVYVHIYIYIVVPYCKGLSESLKRTCNKYGVQVHFKGGITIKILLIAPKGQGSYTVEKWSHLQI